MKRILCILLLIIPGLNLRAAEDLDPEEIIKRFAAKELEFKKVWEKYTYTQHILFQVLSLDGEVREEQEMTVEVYFTSDGKRKTRTLEERGQLRSLRVSKEDLDDAIYRQPFVLTTEELPNYRIEYRGEKLIDELYTYEFDVEPRKIEKGQRYFKGRIWVDDIDFQIVMTRGKVVPDYSNNKFPKFETVREQIDGDYWFPTWTEADDILQFGQRRVRIRELITYENFKKFEVNTSIKYGPIEEVEQEEDK
ncbi:MAG: hypothetical protein E2P05_05625 [Acidobacteria bacterium]|nr:MAG: hypothetical protein E2P08_04075 [Acidobacteriota bacterium]TDI15860.1 MAG: hypothetical protein E2P05_05625 [Acidobacteriota bacterium]